MNKEDIEAARARCSAATEGPWESSEDVRTHAMVIFQPESGDLVVHDGECLSEADAEFIAHTRSDLPAALERIKTLEEEVRSKVGSLMDVRQLGRERLRETYAERDAALEALEEARAEIANLKEDLAQVMGN